MCYFFISVSSSEKKSRAVYGGVLSKGWYQNLFFKFRSGYFDLENVLHSDRLTKADNNKIEALVDADRHIPSREIAGKLKLSNSTLHNHLKRFGFVSKFDT